MCHSCAVCRYSFLNRQWGILAIYFQHTHSLACEQEIILLIHGFSLYFLNTHQKCLPVRIGNMSELKTSKNQHWQLKCICVTIYCFPRNQLSREIILMHMRCVQCTVELAHHFLWTLPKKLHILYPCERMIFHRKPE